MEKRKIILDCDPGHDDAIAIMMAAKHPAIDLLGITIVAGNQTLDKTLINGLNVCQKLEINVPVYAGMPQPIMRQQIVADNIHGETGLDGPVFEPLTRQAESTHAVTKIIAGNTLKPKINPAPSNKVSIFGPTREPKINALPASLYAITLCTPKATFSATQRPGGNQSIMPPITTCNTNAAPTVRRLIFFLFTDSKNAIVSNTTIPRTLLMTSIVIISSCHIGRRLSAHQK